MYQLQLITHFGLDYWCSGMHFGFQYRGTFGEGRFRCCQTYYARIEREERFKGGTVFSYATRRVRNVPLGGEPSEWGGWLLWILVGE